MFNLLNALRCAKASGGGGISVREMSISCENQTNGIKILNTRKYALASAINTNLCGSILTVAHRVEIAVPLSTIKYF